MDIITPLRQVLPDTLPSSRGLFDKSLAICKGAGGHIGFENLVEIVGI